MKKVAIIGGGPVGTMTGILIKELCDNVDVTVFEQREGFTRKQILLLNRTTLDKIMPKYAFDSMKKQGCYVRLPPTDTAGKCYTNTTNKLPFAVSISVIEESLWNYADSIGVNVVRPKQGKGKKSILITDERLKQFDVIIGAGGKGRNGDVVANYLNVSYEESHVGHGMTVTWNPDKYTSFKKSYGTSGTAKQHRFRFFRSPRETNFYGTIQLTPTEFKKLQTARKISDIRDKKVLRRIKSLMDYYNVKDHEYKNQANITTFPITLHQSKRVGGVKKLGKSDKVFLLVGDSTLGVHYFSGTGVNTGFKMAQTAAELICKLSLKKRSSKITRKDQTKLVSEYSKGVFPYIEDALTKSRAVMLKHQTMGVCNRNTVKELRQIVKRKGFKGLSKFPKHDLCLVMANEFID